MRVKFLGEENMPWSFLTQWPQNVIETAERLGYPVRHHQHKHRLQPGFRLLLQRRQTNRQSPDGACTLEITGINDTTGTYSLELR